MAHPVAITRAQFAAISVALYESGFGAGEEITTRAYFDDTDDINVQKLASIGVVTGYGDGKFGPSDLITREQAATMLMRLREAILNDGYTPSTKAPFVDGASSWAATAINGVYELGIMNGYSDTEFGNENKYTIEQSLVTMMRLYYTVAP